MPEMVNVVPTDPIESEWGNDIRDRTVQRYTSSANRTSLHPAPTAGDLSYLADTGSVEVYHSGAWRAMLPAGVVIPFAGSTAPAGFLVCNGSLVSRTTYAALFAVIGVVYGAGDGTTTFGLPDLRQRFPLGKAASGTGATLGATGGDIDHVHSGAAHQHITPNHGHSASRTLAEGAGNTGSGGAHSHALGSSDSGGGHSHSYSDSTGGPSVTSSAPAGPGGTFAGATHSHSFSGSVTSAGGHAHTLGSSDSAAAHQHTVPDHAHDVPAVPSSGSGTSGSAGGGATSQTNPPFIALNYLIKT
jgi:microcystin-dependent protein